MQSIVVGYQVRLRYEKLDDTTARLAPHRGVHGGRVCHFWNAIVAFADETDDNHDTDPLGSDLGERSTKHHAVGEPTQRARDSGTGAGIHAHTGAQAPHGLALCQSRGCRDVRHG